VSEPVSLAHNSLVFDNTKMAVAINRKYTSLREGLVKELNSLSKRFSAKNYSKTENIDKILLKRDISVEKKKRVLLKKLHSSIASAFSIDKKRFNKKFFNALTKRLHSIRKIIIKLRGINYYLETVFLNELNISKININNKGLKPNKGVIARDELEALEYTAYKLIEQVVVLDKRLLCEYEVKETRMLGEEKVKAKDLSSVLGKESELLEHLEAKLPPPSAASIALIKEPTFTHWTARIFALLLHIEHLYAKETAIFSQIKKNKLAGEKINKKILQLMAEKSKLLKIMQQKAASMKKFSLDNNFKKELRNFTTTISL